MQEHSSVAGDPFANMRAIYDDRTVYQPPDAPAWTLP